MRRLAALGLGAALLISCGGDEGRTLQGTFSLIEACGRLSEGYSDISTGTRVVVRNEEGTTLGTGSLRRGKRPCVWQFRFSDVPDSKFYAIEVSHRGEVEFSRAELERNDWKVALGLS